MGCGSGRLCGQYFSLLCSKHVFTLFSVEPTGAAHRISAVLKHHLYTGMCSNILYCARTMHPTHTQPRKHTCTHEHYLKSTALRAWCCSPGVLHRHPVCALFTDLYSICQTWHACYRIYSYMYIKWTTQRQRQCASPCATCATCASTSG